MKKKLIIITDAHEFSDRDIGRFGVEELANFFEVHLIYLSLGTKKAKSSHLKQSDKISIQNIIDTQTIIFENLFEFKEYVKSNSPYFYIDIMKDNVVTILVRRTLKKYGAFRIKLVLGMLPWTNEILGIMHKLKNIKKSGKFISKILARIQYQAAIIFNPRVDLYILSGSKSKPKENKTPAKEIWTHSFDYQKYLDIKDISSGYDGIKNYALFIDQDAPSHPDYALHGNRPPVSKEKYYKSLNSFFDNFESHTGLSVVIASHPRRKEDSNKLWNYRKNFSNKTPELIASSKIVISHYSTALSFAVLWSKPILQITTDEYHNSYRRDQFLGFSQALNLHILNVDRYTNDELENIFDVNKHLYHQYKEQFIKSKCSTSNDIWKYTAKSLSQIKF